MKVKALIEKLRQVNEDKEVQIVILKDGGSDDDTIVCSTRSIAVVEDTPYGGHVATVCIFGEI